MRGSFNCDLRLLLATPLLCFSIFEHGPNTEWNWIVASRISGIFSQELLMATVSSRYENKTSGMSASMRKHVLCQATAARLAGTVARGHPCGIPHVRGPHTTISNSCSSMLRKQMIWRESLTTTSRFELSLASISSKVSRIKRSKHCRWSRLEMKAGSLLPHCASDVIPLFKGHQNNNG